MHPPQIDDAIVTPTDLQYYCQLLQTVTVSYNRSYIFSRFNVDMTVVMKLASHPQPGR